MKFNPTNLPYRKAVHVYIFDDTFEHLLIVRHAGNRHTGNNEWSIPGGGIEVDELPLEAAIREVREEFQIEIELLFKSDHSRRYDWSESFMKTYYKDRKLLYRGQEKIPFIAKYHGPLEQLKVDKAEIVEFKWVMMSEISQYFVAGDSRLENIMHVFGDIDSLYNTNLSDFLIKS